MRSCLVAVLVARSREWRFHESAGMGAADGHPENDARRPIAGRGWNPGKVDGRFGIIYLPLFNN
jgi:hypothetical protein